jgi:hypothetical protein
VEFVIASLATEFRNPNVYAYPVVKILWVQVQGIGLALDQVNASAVRTFAEGKVLIPTICATAPKDLVVVEFRHRYRVSDSIHRLPNVELSGAHADV